MSKPTFKLISDDGCTLRNIVDILRETNKLYGQLCSEKPLTDCKIEDFVQTLPILATDEAHKLKRLNYTRRSICRSENIPDASGIFHVFIYE